jgi:hypothetical protein
MAREGSDNVWLQLTIVLPRLTRTQQFGIVLAAV